MHKLPRFRRDRMLLLKRFEDRVLGVEAFLLLMKALREDYGILSCPDMVYGVHGKPSFARHPEIFFSLSHCRSGAMCVVSRGNVGCDIESANRNVSEAVMSRCFNSRETRAVHASSNPSLEFARIWTRKEAVLKCTGAGLSQPMNAFSVLGDTASPEGALLSLYTVEYGNYMLSAAAARSAVFTPQRVDALELL